MTTFNQKTTVLLINALLLTKLTVSSASAQDYNFSTIAGGSQGSLDGADANAQFYNPMAVAVDGAGNLYVADQANNRIRKMTPSGTNWIVTTIAGAGAGSGDGLNTNAHFFSPTGVAVDVSGNLFVADQYNNSIRKIAPAGTNWIVTTIAGSAGVSGFIDGTNAVARFANPAAIAVDLSGNLFVADEVNNAIRKIAPVGTNWVVTTLAGGSAGSNDGTNTAAQFFRPSGLAVDAAGRIFVADQFNNTIRLITASGTNWVVTTIAGQPVSGHSDGLGTNSLFYSPVGVAVGVSNTVYVVDFFNSSIRRLAPSGTNWLVSTIGGGSRGTNDGVGTNAAFYYPFGIAADAFGDVFVADAGNNSIRLGLATNAVAAKGALQVLMTPPGAVSAGANWRVDGGAFQTNGAIFAGLTFGAHTISFKTVAGFTTPALQVVPVTARQTNVLSGIYAVAIPNAGSLQVMISPSDSVAAGAKWKVDGGNLQTNGGIVAGLSIGSHTLSFNVVPGWTAPSNQTVFITNSQTTLAAGTYILQTGSLQVNILPASVVNLGAKWQVDGGLYQSSGTALTGLLPGAHTLSFNTVLGWVAPVNQTITITNAQTNLLSLIYTRPPQLYSVSTSGGKFQFAMRGLVGSNYVIQATTNFLVWTSLSTNPVPPGGAMIITDSNMISYAHRFYRAVPLSSGPPKLSGLAMSNHIAHFSVSDQAGNIFVIQTSSNLTTWSNLLTNTIPWAGSISINDAGATNQSKRFYRAVRQ